MYLGNVKCLVSEDSDYSKQIAQYNKTRSVCRNVTVFILENNQPDNVRTV